MIDNDIVLARIKRSGIIGLAGSYYKTESDVPTIPALENNDVLFMLYKSRNCWTAISREKLYFKVGSDFGSMTVSDAGEQFHNFGFSNGKDIEKEFVVLENSKTIWVINSAVSCAIENIILLLKNDGC